MSASLSKDKKRASEAELREMAKTLTRHEIANKLGVHITQISAAFGLLGISTAIKDKTQGRLAMVPKWLEAGMTMGEAAKALGMPMQTLRYKLQIEGLYTARKYSPKDSVNETRQGAVQ